MDDELHTLSGAYAVHALPPADVAPFEEHLSTCRTCPAEVRRLRETAARLALAAATPPPARLRPRILTAAHHARDPHGRAGAGPRSGDPRFDGSPKADGEIHPRPSGGFRSGEGRNVDGGFRSGERTNADGGLRFAGSWDSDGEPEHPASGVFRLGESGTHAGSLPTRPYFAAPRPGEPVSPGDEPGENAVSLRRWRGRALAGFAAVSTAAAVALGVVAFDARRDLDARETAMAAVLAAPDARTVRHRIAPGGTGTAVVSRDQGRILFTSRGMPEPPPSKVYALWLMGPGGVRPAALLDPGEDGLTTPVLADLGDADHLGLTVEPAGGSDRPTTRPILFTPLPAS